MQKELLKDKPQWNELKKRLKREDTGLDFQKEKNPKQYPCFVFYYYANDLEFGNVHGVGFCYASDFEK